MVNPAITAALIAASQQQEAQENIEGKLKEAKATRLTRAIALDIEEKQQPLLDQALAAGTVKRTSDGRYYLNEQAIADRTEAQGFKVLLIILIALSVIATGAVLVARAGG
jgi:hypothetical protein